MTPSEAEAVMDNSPDERKLPLMDHWMKAANAQPQ